MNDYKIKELYEEMEMELISSMKRNLNRHLNEEVKTGFQYTQWQAEKLKELSKYRKQNKEIIGEYTNNMNKKVAKQIQGEVKQGSINAIKQYNKALGKDLKPSKLMNKSFFKTNDRKIDALIKVVNNDLKTANSSALRMINDQYRQTIHKSAFFVGNGVFTEQQAARMATKELSELKKAQFAIDEANKGFLAGGLNCIQYKDGRRVNIASYAQMAVRTANLRAQLMGEGDFRKSIGRTLVQATSHGGACPICQKWQNHIFIDDVYSGGTKEDGNYMLLSEAMKQGFLHPNCRHGLTTYYPELDGIENESEEEYQADIDYINEKLNYYDRNIKKYDRLEKGSLAPLNIQQFASKKKQWTNSKELLLKKNDIAQYKDYSNAIEKGYWNGKMQYCENITEQWLGVKTNKTNNVLIPKIGDVIKYKGKEYLIDNVHVKLDFKMGEDKFAKKIAKFTDKKIELYPRFDFFRSEDSLIGNEYVDFKITTSGTDKFIFNNINEAIGQSENFIFWVKNKKIPKDIINYQIDNVFRRIKEIKVVGYYKKGKIYIFKRK